MRRVSFTSNVAEGAVEHPLVKFYVYETRARYYVVGRDASKVRWRILKIDRSEPSDLVLTEDPVWYDKRACVRLLTELAEGNKASGGLNFVTKAHGIVGFIKFREPFYMMLIKKKVQVGCICGHAIFKVGDSQLITVPHQSVHTSMASSKTEQRYKKLMAGVDLTKDFYFSYTYPLMHSLQHNVVAGLFPRGLPFDHMFVWNSYLTRPFRNQDTGIPNSGARWIVPLIHGFFDQVMFSIFGRIISLTLIARRSRHFAGTRYLKRGVNDKGRVANDVETEQILVDEATVSSETQPLHASSIVQVRGSIPLFWSQEASTLSPKPDIILHRHDPLYEATRLHFRNLVQRYGEPIIILNLIKTYEKHPREMILRREYKTAVMYLNKTAESAGMEKFEYIHWDFHHLVKNRGGAPSVNSISVLAPLTEIIQKCLDLTSYFYSGTSLTSERLAQTQAHESHQEEQRQLLFEVSEARHDRRSDSIFNLGSPDSASILAPKLSQGLASFQEGDIRDSRLHKTEERAAMYQNGTVRTNCIDCLDRTNIAQYVISQEALARQLCSLGVLDKPVLPGSAENDAAQALMSMFVAMGDALALQYGGSAAHNDVMVPSERKGQWRAALKSRELFRSIQRYYSNAITDAEKQDALNLFLGHFRPQDNQPALWELDSDYHLHVGGANSPPDSPSALSSRSSMAFGTSNTREQQPETTAQFPTIPGSVDAASNPHSFTFSPLPLSAVDGSENRLVSFDKLIPRMNLSKLKPVRLYSDTPGGSTPGSDAGRRMQDAMLRQAISNDRTTSEATTPAGFRPLRDLGGGVAAKIREEDVSLKDKYGLWMEPFLGQTEAAAAVEAELRMAEGVEGSEEFYSHYMAAPLCILDTPDNLVVHRQMLDPWATMELPGAAEITMHEYLHRFGRLSSHLNADAPNVGPAALCGSDVDFWISQTLQAQSALRFAELEQTQESLSLDVW